MEPDPVAGHTAADHHLSVFLLSDPKLQPCIHSHGRNSQLVMTVHVTSMQQRKLNLLGESPSGAGHTEHTKLPDLNI